jgi:hypothetical protein
MKVFLLILLLSASAFAQGAQCADTEGTTAPFRFTLPVKFTDYSGQKLFFSVSKQREVIVTEMSVDEHSQFPVGFEKDYKDGRWYIFFCKDTPDLVAWVQKISSKQGGKLETRAEQIKRIENLKRKKE